MNYVHGKFKDAHKIYKSFGHNAPFALYLLCLFVFGLMSFVFSGGDSDIKVNSIPVPSKFEFVAFIYAWLFWQVYVLIRAFKINSIGAFVGSFLISTFFVWAIMLRSPTQNMIQELSSTLATKDAIRTEMSNLGYSLEDYNWSDFKNLSTYVARHEDLSK